MSSSSLKQDYKTKTVIKEMKKIEYQAPEMEVINLSVQEPMLIVVSPSDEKPSGGGELPGEGPEE